MDIVTKHSALNGRKWNGEPKERKYISIEKLTGGKFRAEIPERWGKRVLIINICDKGYIKEGYKEATFNIHYVKNNGSVSKPMSSYLTWKLYPNPYNPYETTEDTIERVVNNYFNPDFWILRALRA